MNAAVVDQQNTSVTDSGFGFDTTSWFGQTFTARISGQLAQTAVNLFCSSCTGTTPNITVALRSTSGNLPTGADLATATIPGFSSGAGGYFSAIFAVPPTLVSGTQYAIVLRPVSNPSTGSTVAWPGISWTQAAPANTTLRYQAAASNSANGPVAFVGPDGTAGIFFTVSGAALTQFDGNRYLKYKAYLTTTDNAATPTINDVTVCYNTAGVADVSIAKTDGLAGVVPEGSVTYSIVVSNPAAVAISGVSLSDIVPGILTGCTWTCVAPGGSCAPANGNGSIASTLTVAAAGAATATLSCTVSPGTAGSVSNTATFTYANDPNTANNTATDTDTTLPEDVFEDGFESP